MRVFFSFLLAMLLVGLGQAQSIFTNPITGTQPSTANPYTTGQTVNSGITVSGIGRGSGVATNAGNDRYNLTHIAAQIHSNVKKPAIFC